MLSQKASYGSKGSAPLDYGGEYESDLGEYTHTSTANFSTTNNLSNSHHDQTIEMAPIPIEFYGPLPAWDIIIVLFVFTYIYAAWHNEFDVTPIWTIFFSVTLLLLFGFR